MNKKDMNTIRFFNSIPVSDLFNSLWRWEQRSSCDVPWRRYEQWHVLCWYHWNKSPRIYISRRVSFPFLQNPDLKHMEVSLNILIFEHNHILWSRHLDTRLLNTTELSKIVPVCVPNCSYLFAMLFHFVRHWNLNNGLVSLVRVDKSSSLRLQSKVFKATFQGC